MGKILLYKAGRACQSFLANTTGSTQTSVHPFKTVDGTEYDYMRYSTSSSNIAATLKNLLFYDDLTGYISADTEEDFSLDHYTTREIANVSYSRTATNQTGGKIYTIQATNNGSAEITVGSIKFTKGLYIITGGTYPTCLILGYFLDTPVTIGVGETKTFVLNFDS